MQRVGDTLRRKFVGTLAGIATRQRVGDTLTRKFVGILAGIATRRNEDLNILLMFKTDRQAQGSSGAGHTPSRSTP